MTVIRCDHGSSSARFALERERTRRRLQEMSSHFSTPASWGEGGHAVREQNLNPISLPSFHPVYLSLHRFFSFLLNYSF